MAFVSASDDSDVMQEEEKVDKRLSIMKYIRQCYPDHQIEDGLELRSLQYIQRYFEKLQDSQRKRQEKPKLALNFQYLNDFKLEDDSIQQQREYKQRTNPQIKYQNQNQKQPYSQIDRSLFSKFRRYQEKPKIIQKSFLKMEESDLYRGEIFQQQIEEKALKFKSGPQPKLKQSSQDDQWIQQKRIRNKQKSTSAQPRQQPDLKTKLKKETEKNLKQEPQSKMKNSTMLYLDGKKVQKNKMKSEKLKPRASKVKQEQKQEQPSVSFPQKKKFLRKPKILMRRTVGDKGLWTMDPYLNRLPEYIREVKARTQKYLKIMHQILYPNNLTPFEYFLKVGKRLAKLNFFPTIKYVTSLFELQKQDNLDQIQDFLESMLKYIRIKGIQNVKMFENKSKFLSEMRILQKCQIYQKRAQQNKTQYGARQLQREADNKIKKFIQVIERGKINETRFEADIIDQQKRSKMEKLNFFQEIFYDYQENKEMMCKQQNIMLERPFELEFVRSSDQENNHHR